MSNIFRDPFGSISDLAAETHELLSGTIEFQNAVNTGGAFTLPEVIFDEITVPFGKLKDIKIDVSYGSSYATLVNGAPSDFDVELSGEFQFGGVRSPMDVKAVITLNANPSAEHEVLLSFGLSTTFELGNLPIQPQVSLGVSLEVSPSMIISGGGSFGYGYVGDLSDLGFPGAAQLQEALGLDIEANWIITFGFSVNHQGHLDLTLEIQVVAEAEMVNLASGVEESLRVGGRAMIGTTLFDGVPDLQWNIGFKVQQFAKLDGRQVRSVEWEVNYAGEVRVSVIDALRATGEAIGNAASQASEAASREWNDRVVRPGSAAIRRTECELIWRYGGRNLYNLLCR